jgi:hypothetical protein
MIVIRDKGELEKFEENESVDTIHLKTRLSKPIIISILNKFKNIKRIYNPSCYYKKTSKKILNALDKIGVEVIETKIIGKKRKLNWNKIIDLYKKGYPISCIAKQFKIQRKSVYYILKKRGLK